MSDKPLEDLILAEHSPEPLPLEWAAAIGNVANGWSAVEMEMRRFIGLMFDAGWFTMMAVTAELPAVVLINLINVLIKMVGDDALTKYWTGVERILTSLRARRNDVIHSHYGLLEGRVIAQREKARGAYKFHEPQPTLATLASLIEDMRRAEIKILRTMTLFYSVDGKDTLKKFTPPGLNLFPDSSKPSPKRTPRPPKLSSAQKRKTRETNGGGA